MRLLAATLLTLISSGAAAGAWEAELELEGAFYPEPSPQPRSDYRHNSSVAATISKSFDWKQSFVDIELFAREDKRDGERSHFDIRELMLTYPGDGFDFKIGVGRTFWGFTESVHLVDTINQTDFVESSNGEEKLGQPMVNVSWFKDSGTYEFWFLPKFRPRTFAGPDGRPALPLTISQDRNDHQYQSDRGDSHPDWAARWTHSIGAFDLGLSWFQGTERNPRTEVCFSRNSIFAAGNDGPNCDIQGTFPFATALLNTVAGFGFDQLSAAVQNAVLNALPNLQLIQHYDQTRRLGLELQWNLGDALVKLEGLSANQDQDYYWAAVTGVEYVKSSLFDLPFDFRVFAEYLYDNRDPFRYQNLFDDDIFLGGRFEFQDAQSTTLLIGAIYDQDTYEIIYQIEGTRRIGNSASISIEGQAFSHMSHVASQDATSFFASADVYKLKLTLFF